MSDRLLSPRYEKSGQDRANVDSNKERRISINSNREIKEGHGSQALSKISSTSIIVAAGPGRRTVELQRGPEECVSTRAYHVSKFWGNYSPVGCK
ncbi:hypothetical protein J6590_003289 [Homalodisca vitripennis]|nr:hypothetical protein J6590_003289 [Homalodisca vitripennis]